MQGIILGAGAGSRLHPFTARLPKPLLPVRGVPMAAYQARLLRAWGVSPVWLFVRDRYSVAVTEGALAPFGEDIRIIRLSTTTWRGMWAAAAEVGTRGPTLIVNGDLLLSEEWRGLLDRHAQEGAMVSIACQPDGIADNSVGKTRWARVRGHLLTSHAAASAGGDEPIDEIGMSIVSPEVWPHVLGLPYLEEDPWSDELLPTLTGQGKRVAVFRASAFWQDVGTWKGVLDAHRNASRSGHRALFGELGGYDGHAASTCDGVDATATIAADSWVARDAWIGPRAVVQASVVMAGARINAGACLQNTVVLPCGVVETGLRIDSGVVGPDAPTPA